ncbi:hypothetical protein NS277_00150 [Novosphingobium barchaimii]|nr:hypothetical protein NS277_00150 [Novosphingobium barchaimii]
MRRTCLVALALLAVAACAPRKPDAGGEGQTSGASKAPPAFAICAGCHSIRPGGGGSGPSLAGVWGRKAGTLPGYPYSEALAKSGIVWDDKSLDRWLAGPIQMVPGTKMVFGIPDQGARKDVVDYLKTLK